MNAYCVPTVQAVISAQTAKCASTVPKTTAVTALNAATALWIMSPVPAAADAAVSARTNRSEQALPRM